MYGLQARGLDGAMVPHIDVTSAARAYVKAVRTVQPHGPYRLLGHSFGGWIAFEMGLQLGAQNQEVVDLTLVDSSIPNCVDAPDKPIHRIQTLLHLIELYDMQLATPMALAECDFIELGEDEQIALLHGALCKAGVFHAKTPVKVLQGVIRVFEANLATRYHPGASYAGTLRLVSALEGGDETPERITEGWAKYARTVDHLELSGNHMTMIAAPHVDQLGKALAQCSATVKQSELVGNLEACQPVRE